MVGFAAALAHGSGSLLSGALYMVGCVSCGLVAHAIGRYAAVRVFSGGSMAAYSSPSAREDLNKAAVLRFGETRTHDALLGAVVAYIAGTYALVAAGLEDFDDADVSDAYEGLPSLIAYLDADKNRLLVAMTMSVLGAASGNALGSYVDAALGADADAVPRGTLVCNSLFAVLGISLQVRARRPAPCARHARSSPCHPRSLSPSRAARPVLVLR